jgi:hypothetical protein
MAMLRGSHSSRWNPCRRQQRLSSTAKSDRAHSALLARSCQESQPPHSQPYLQTNRLNADPRTKRTAAGAEGTATSSVVGGKARPLSVVTPPCLWPAMPRWVRATGLSATAVETPGASAEKLIRKDPVPHNHSRPVPIPLPIPMPPQPSRFGRTPTNLQSPT